MRKLWRPVPQEHPFPSVEDWGRGFTRLRRHFNGGHGPFPPALLEEAETLYAELGASMAAPVVLHGDLHHDNILAAQRELWLAIDPNMSRQMFIALYSLYYRPERSSPQPADT